MQEGRRERRREGGVVAMPWQMDRGEGQRSGFAENREKEGGNEEGTG